MTTLEMPLPAKTPQNLKDFKVLWAKAITRVDNHALTCKGCATPRNPHVLAVTLGSLTDPSLERYRPCRIAEKLYKLEREAMDAYRTRGPLPA